MKETLMKDLGSVLPIGNPKMKSKDFSFKFWGLNEEKEIAEIKKKITSHGDFVNKVLVKMLNSFGGETFDGENKEQSDMLRLKLNQLPLMDVLYMYIYLRYDQLDENIRMNVGCSSCGRVNKDFVANMENLDIDVIEWGPEGDDEVIEYVLKKPFTLGNEEIKLLKIRRTPWDAMERATDEITVNAGKMMELVFDHSICGVNDEEGPGAVNMHELLKKLHKRDFERLSGKIHKHNAGPNLVISDKCKYCGSEFYQQLDWSYDNFFATSSLPLD